jgi:hypothetical protein
MRLAMGSGAGLYRGVVGRLALITLLGAGNLAGCANYVPRASAGETLADVQSHNGPPTGRYDLPGGGQRIEYARGPYGKHTWMIDVGADSKVISVQQVLTEKRFYEITPGMPADEVLLRLGRPSAVGGGGWQGGQYWSYRYQATFCQWFVIGITPQRQVRDAGMAPDPQCDDDDVPAIARH